MISPIVLYILFIGLYRLNFNDDDILLLKYRKSRNRKLVMKSILIFDFFFIFRNIVRNVNFFVKPFVQIDHFASKATKRTSRQVRRFRNGNLFSTCRTCIFYIGTNHFLSLFYFFYFVQLILFNLCILYLSLFCLFSSLLIGS